MVKFDLVENESRYKIGQLLEIMRILRSPKGCPWDREQTHKSIRNEVLEETYEVCDAIDNNDKISLCEELGDLLLQVVFHSIIEEEEGGFNFDDVTDGICRKLILRHPHVFKDAKADDSAQVLDMWDEIKKEEKHQNSYTETLKSVPIAFPALMRAAKVEKRGFKGGVEIDNSAESLLDKTKLLNTLVGQKDKDATLKAYGDLLFTLASLQRKMGINPEEALNAATNKFIQEFEQAELAAQKSSAKPTPKEIGQAYRDAK